MRSQWIRFPVTCPICNEECLSAARVAQVEGASHSGRPFELYTSCHDHRWHASPRELQQILEYIEGVRARGPQAYAHARG